MVYEMLYEVCEHGNLSPCVYCQRDRIAALEAELAHERETVARMLKSAEHLGISPRSETVKFIADQLSGKHKCSLPKPYTHHYGVQELRELMDFIYRELPQSEDEKL